MKDKIKDILIRALKTTIQGALATLPVSLSVSQISDKAYLYSLLIGAIAGGISAFMNFILALLKKEL